MEKTISVEQRHINAGHRDSCYFCPISLAIKEIIGDPDEIIFVGETDYHRGYCGDKSNPIRKLPKEARAFIRAFDAGRSVKPFSFVLDL